MPQNKDLLSPYQQPLAPDPDLAAALQRTASFALIRDILSDIGEAVDEHEQTHHQPQVDGVPRLLLTAQLEALRYQAESCKTAMLEKIQRGEHVLPFMLQPAYFRYFLHQNHQVLCHLISACQCGGPQRKAAIDSVLTDMAVKYLSMTNRLPNGMAPGVFHEVNGTRFTGGRVSVWTTPEMESCTEFETDEQNGHAVILINTLACPHPYFDPARSGNLAQFAVSGFEHCPVPQKQAAMLLQQLFYELADLEISVAILKGKSSANPAEQRTAHHCEEEVEYYGSVAMGDWCGPLSSPNPRQRQPMTDHAIELSAKARAYRSLHRQPLVLDPGLCEWLESVQFTRDLECIHQPQTRIWLMAVDQVRAALKANVLFTGPAV